MDNKMTDDEIKQALECCHNNDNKTCRRCYFRQDRYCREILAEHALDLINRQQAEIERLEKENEVMKTNYNSMCMSMPNIAKAERTEAIKEFAERVKDMTILSTLNTIGVKMVKIDDINNLVKEMVGE